MRSRLRAGAFAICCLGFALPAAAQLDSAALRAKLGSPLNRETFHMPSGFDLIVDYGAGNEVCKLEVPALMPANGKISKASDSTQQMYDFLAELVPASMRGKELGRFMSMMGIFSMSIVQYEHVTVSESQRFPDRQYDTITVRFKSDDCQTPASQ
jgi:hypothetical protein